MPGCTFTTIHGPPQINGLGQVAFQADVKNPLGYQDVRFLFATDANGVINLVAGKGTPLTFGGNPYDTVSLTDFYPFSDADSLQFNNADQLSFFAYTTGASGAVVVASITVPEPASLTLLAFCAIGLLRRRGPSHRRPAHVPTRI